MPGLPLTSACLGSGAAARAAVASSTARAWTDSSRVCDGEVRVTLTAAPSAGKLVPPGAARELNLSRAGADGAAAAQMPPGDDAVVLAGPQSIGCPPRDAAADKP